MSAEASRDNPIDVPALRQVHYNASVSYLKRVHDDLMIIRVRPDRGGFRYIPGQYTSLGLGYWEPRLAHVQEDAIRPQQITQVVKRAYSISFCLLDEEGQLRRPTDAADVELYIALIRHAEKRAPALTPRLFAMAAGDRLFLGAQAHGNYTLAGVEPDDHVIFAATGTGEAPHNAMIAELLSRGHRGRIAAITCVRYGRDLAYLPAHRRLAQLYDNYFYVGLTTREPCNLDTARADYVGKFHLQEYFASGRFEQAWGMTLDPARTHVFLCGNPVMIGAPRTSAETRAVPAPTGMVQVLESRGFSLDEPGRRGNIHLEKYW